MGDRKNPYVGPRPYELNEKHLFHGREGETNELFSLVRAHQVVLFYSQSGAGKTSLLNAGVIPRLQEEKAEVFGVARVGGKLPKEVSEGEIDNVFIFNTLLSLQGEKKQFPAGELSRMSLTRYLKLQQPEDRQKYFYPLHVIVFDQFEELFTSFPKHWQKREQFFVSVSEALTHDPLLRAVFAMREEYVAALDPFAQMLPQRLQKRFRLERLREEAAVAAIQMPLEGTGRSFGPKAVNKLVNNLMQVPVKYVGGIIPVTGEFVEPVQLQIVCHSLWENLPDEVRVISESVIAELGDVDTALAKYYDECLEKVVKTYPDVDEAGLRKWFGESLITPIGTRGTVFMDEGRTEDNLSERVVKMLDDLHLIRAELRGGAKWYELTHDRFIEPIRRSNEEWFASLPGDQQFIYEMDKRAGEWERAGRRNSKLLKDEELSKIKQTLKQHTNLNSFVTERLRDYLNASEAASERRKRKALYKRVTVILVVAVIVATFVPTAIYYRFKARQAASARKDKQARRADQAQEYASVKGKEYTALAFGIEAVGLSGLNDVPPEAERGLRIALAVIDDKVWLRDSMVSPSRLEISANGGVVLAVNSNECAVWDAVTGRKYFGQPRPEGGEWRQLALSPDGEFLFAIVAPSKIEGDQRQLKVEQGVVSPNVKSADERVVLILDAQTGQTLADLQSKLKGVRSMQVSNNAGHILADFPNSVKVLEVSSGDVKSPAPAKQEQWLQIAISPDGSRLVAVYGGSKVEVLATDSGRVVGSFNVGTPRTGERDFIAFSPDGKRGMLARPVGKSGEAVAVVWDDTGGRPPATFKVKVGAIQSAGISPDGDGVVVFGKEQAGVYHVAAGSVNEVTLPPGVATQYSGTNVLLIQTVNGRSTVLAWNALTGTPQVLAQADADKYKFSKAAMTPDARHIVTVSEDNILQVWAVGESPNLNELTPPEMLKLACGKLRDQKEYEQVSDLCEGHVRQ